MTILQRILFCVAILAVGASRAGAADTAEVRLRSDTAEVRLRSDTDGVHVRYSLATPTDRLTFEDAHIIRTLWTVETPGLRLDGDTVVSDQPFSTVEIAIAPDAEEIDRVYMGLVRVGDGWIVHGPALAIQGVETVLTVDLAPDQAALPESGGIAGAVYVGPTKAIIAENDALVVTGATVGEPLSAPMREAFVTARQFYGTRLGLSLPFTPALVITVDSPGPSQFRGDVSETGLISTRFHGDWSGPQEETAPYVKSFVWHESFHLWNGHGVALDDGSTAPWLHEGGAEYAAVMGAVSTGDMSEAAARASLTQRLNGCRSVLEARALNGRGPRSGSGVYDCGVLIQWLTDLMLREAGDQTVMDLWREMLTEGRRTGSYGVAEFRAWPQADAAVALVLEGPGEARWGAIEARLAALGVGLEDRPSDDDYRRAVLWHLNGQNCSGGGTGYYTNPEGIKLDTGDRCGVLSGDPEIAAVEGFDPIAEVKPMFDAVTARCATGGPVRYNVRGGAVIEAKCAAPLDAPKTYFVAAAPAIALRP
ncbi:hypothetical protein [Brevundimonas sp.]|jgi:hypothetical protein|uniref:hypothetical protein n=1 Tax=Brevundimonas sp. TaxID=1871086 RepID=UPI0037BFA561